MMQQKYQRQFKLAESIHKYSIKDRKQKSNLVIWESKRD